MLFGLGKPDPREGYETLRLNRILQAAQKTRVHGAAAPDICYVACGRADGYIDEGVFLWDYAAAGLIATRAGARFDILRDYPDGRQQCLVTNGHIHRELRDLCIPA